MRPQAFDALAMDREASIRRMTAAVYSLVFELPFEMSPEIRAEVVKRVAGRFATWGTTWAVHGHNSRGEPQPHAHLLILGGPSGERPVDGGEAVKEMRTFVADTINETHVDMTGKRLTVEICGGTLEDTGISRPPRPRIPRGLWRARERRQDLLAEGRKPTKVCLKLAQAADRIDAAYERELTAAPSDTDAPATLATCETAPLAPAQDNGHDAASARIADTPMSKPAGAEGNLTHTDDDYIASLKAENARARRAEDRHEALLFRWRKESDLQHAERQRLMRLVEAMSTHTQSQDAFAAERLDIMAAKRPDELNPNLRDALASHQRILAKLLRHQHRLDHTLAQAREENGHLKAEVAQLGKALIAARGDGSTARQDAATLREELGRARSSDSTRGGGSKPPARRAPKKTAEGPAPQKDTALPAPPLSGVGSAVSTDMAAVLAQRLKTFARAADWDLIDGAARRSLFGGLLELSGEAGGTYLVRALDGREISMPTLVGAITILHGMEHRPESDPLTKAERRIAASIDAGEAPDPFDIDCVRRAPPPSHAAPPAAPPSLPPAVPATGTAGSGGSGGGGGGLALPSAQPPIDRSAPATANPRQRPTEIG